MAYGLSPLLETQREMPAPLPCEAHSPNQEPRATALLPHSKSGGPRSAGWGHKGQLSASVLCSDTSSPQAPCLPRLLYILQEAFRDSALCPWYLALALPCLCAQHGP